MKFDPRPWQPDMIEHLLKHDRCALFAAMGGGKTVVTLTVEQAADLTGDGPVLILGPKRVAKNVWPGETEKWDHLKGLRFSTILGTPEQRRSALKADAQFFTCNYDNLPWLVDTLGEDWPFKSIIADELTRLKAHRLRQGGKRTAALAKVAFSKAKRFIGLTGTPAPNGYKDLWGQLWFLDRGERLGRSFDAYSDRWFRRVGNGFGYGMELMPYSENEINQRIKDICLTVDPRDYGVNVAEPIRHAVEVELPSRARAHYREMERTFFTQIKDHEIDAASAGVKSLKLLQMAAGAVYTGDGKSFEVLHDAKIEALGSILEEANGAPVLVSYRFQHDLERITKAFPFARRLDDRKATEDAWNRGEIPLLAAHPASAGHGLNLQVGGNILVYFSSDWDLELDDQILERIGPLRQLQSGLDRSVFVYRIVTRDTLDETVLLRHASKRSTQDLLMEALKKWS